MRQARRAWLTAAGAALVVGGCGQKGPLYLPDKGGKVVTSTPAATAAQPAAPATAAKPAGQDKDKDQPPKP